MRQGELCTWHFPYTNYSILTRESCVCDILHTLITIHLHRYVHFPYTNYSILTRESCVFNYSLLVRENCVFDILHTLIINYSSGRVVFDILHTLIINYSSGRVVHLAIPIHYLLITHQGELCI